MVSRMKLVVPFMMPLMRMTGSCSAQRFRLVSQGMPPPAAAVHRSATPRSLDRATSSL